MATHAKLEFYTFQLNPKKEKVKTFRDFATEELKAGKNPADSKVVELCFKHFVKSLTGEYSKDEHMKKRLGFEKKKSINRYYDKGPTFNSADHTIYGVINGGPYGRERIISNNDDEEDSISLGINKSVLMYFFFFAYLPPDHHEGFFMIHSNSKDESITPLFRSYMTNIFRGANFKKPSPEEFCPKSFQKEFREGSVLKSMVFKSSFVDSIHNTDGISHLLSAYDIRIEARPKRKDVPASMAKDFSAKLLAKVFGTKSKERSLNDFNEQQVILESDITHSQKTFEWNTKDNDFVPVVYLQGRVARLNTDGTPDFEELKDYCTTIFKDEILPEIRPDLNVSKA